MRKATVFILFNAFVALSLPSAIGAEPILHAVQVHANRAGAGGVEQASGKAELVVELEMAGFGPVWQLIDDTHERVLVGKLNNRTDALLLRQELREFGIEGAFVKKFPDSIFENPEIQSPGRSALHDILCRDADEAASLPDSASESSVRALLNTLHGKTPEEIKLVLTANQNRRTAGNALAAARVALTEHGDVDTAEELTKFIAYSATHVHPQTLIQGAILYADVIHEYRGDFLGAFKIYDGLIENESLNEGQKVRLEVMRAATLLSLCRAKRADFDYVDWELAQVINRIPTQFVNARSVLRLMHAEVPYFQDDYPTAIRRFEAFLANPEAQVRETGMARFLLGRSKYLSQDFEGAISILLENLGTPPPADSTFYWAGSLRSPQQLSAQQLDHIDRFTPAVLSASIRNLIEEYDNHRLYEPKIENSELVWNPYGFLEHVRSESTRP